ncbi:pentapeptide repeat-containing protein [Myxococcus sp. RHSTA-1-4]|uniref:pentapeptide repeat-containing protein n=1 Tax=Myxococcus sp. RHSTA-1-4 TaxID=2874601 RepID=UPI001CBCB4BC|nr:pentapeptide repeat-containing protein [Myxococcus sp. RHSTA-1-4]MBZ4421258.1 pentapeptide repeat-containing protein [Myxococcus sp. RHSTA-1-4]
MAYILATGLLKGQVLWWFLAALLVSCALLFFILVIFVAPAIIVDRSLRKQGAQTPIAAPEHLKAQNDVRTVLVQALGMIFFAATAFFTWQQFRQAKEEQLTSRFTMAVEQFGRYEVDVRLGGIHALTRIARDSESDREAIVDMLSAFVRKNSNYNDPDSPPKPLDSLRALELRDPDLQAAMDALTGEALRNGNDIHFILDEVDLRRADLDDANLEGASLARAHLEDARLVNAHLEGVNLEGANLEGANLEGANLEGANLEGANLEGAKNLTTARLKGAHANKYTKWPNSFNWGAAGVIMDEALVGPEPHKKAEAPRRLVGG